MKVKVNRLLTAGNYHVNFEVGDFSHEELEKMGSFGIPAIPMRWIRGDGQLMNTAVAVNQITKRFDAVFSTEEDALQYETSVLGNIAIAMKNLRERTDGFTSSKEVEV